MNVRLLRRVAKYISEEPQRFIMGEGIAFINNEGTVHDHGYAGNGVLFDFTVKPPCGTAACIAGTAVVLTNKPNRAEAYHDRIENKPKILWSSVFYDAKRYLGLTDAQADNLFLVTGWYPKFRKRFLQAKTQRGRVNAAVGQIDEFIARRGKA